MPRESSYLFLEMALMVYLVGFGLQPWADARIATKRTAGAALGLAALWLCLDQVAIHLRIWSFPAGGTFPMRVLGLPVEEHVLFFLHTIICLVLIQQDRRVQR